ncbi:uncharacterized protein BX664DRAFT_341181 [Halteromyces radiatus]|uniref:uncharacterized protein n=1 Tax=Halteromyces radiatus TaxID=101107 RepID=UPI00221F87B2|nr:uncharacterized protein BX664DRAFT_341181 [Halteromyces radiatus]KAI8081744.1 hypothetical protein BX664DRAFT_341181 [Halteromyces radiatus]
MHPLLLFSIVAGGTVFAILGALEARHLYETYRERQEYERFCQHYAKMNESKEFEPDSDDEEEKANTSARQRTDHLVRHRHPLPSQSPNSVSDQAWVDRTEIELNELERKLSDRKRHLELEQALLDQAEMDLEQRRRSMERRDHHHRVLSERQSSPFDDNDNKHTDSLDSFLTTDTPDPTKSFNGSLLRPLSSTPRQHDLSSSSYATLPLINRDVEDMKTDNRNDNTPPAEQDDLSPLNIQSHDNATPEEPWCYEGSEDDDDEPSTCQRSMRFPTQDGNGNNIEPESDDQSSWNSSYSVQRSATNDDDDTSYDDMSSFNTLRSPSSPSSDGHSFDLLTNSDVENGH